jgi:hypothetical protein
MQLAAYRSERLPIVTVGAVSLALAAAVQARRPIDPVAFCIDLILAATLFAQFRIWDDIADRDPDRLAHPGRVLVRAPSIAPFATLCAALAVVTAILLIARGAAPGALLIYGATIASLAVWYSARGSRTVASDHVILAKYPAFASIIAASRGREDGMASLLSIAAVYLGACVYEGLHDPRSPSARWPMLVAFESLLLIGTLALAAMRGDQ